MPDDTGELRPPLDLESIQARADAASPGPWGVVRQPFDEAHVVPLIGGDTIAISQINDMDPDGDDAIFIAHARSDVPDLLARVRELEADAVTVGHERNDDLAAISDWMADARRVYREVEAYARRLSDASHDYRTRDAGRHILTLLGDRFGDPE